MHMADALISPAVGGAMWAVSGGLIAYCSHKIKECMDGSMVPLMGVLGAFIFAAQMVNFSIPGTGSSGHLGGGMILAILLGPWAAFIVMGSVLTVQALFFADGGLLALGCNIFNLGFFPSFIAYPLLYKTMAGGRPTRGKIIAGSILASIVSLQMGAFGVVLQTSLSGISELPFKTFMLLMQSIHLAIGVVEGLVTAAVVVFVWKARPEILSIAPGAESSVKTGVKKIVTGLLLAAVVTGGVLSWFASSNPDGLEWAIFRTSGREELKAKGMIYSSFSGVQEKTAILPDYGFKTAEANVTPDESNGQSWPSVGAGTTVAGLVGGGITLFLASLTGWVLKKRGTS